MFPLSREISILASSCNKCVTICDDSCGNNRFNITINKYSEELGGSQSSVIKNVMNEHKANVIFNNLNKENVVMAFELMS